MQETTEASREQAGPGEPLRVAVVGTPRSGNTWLRALLAASYGLEEMPTSRVEDLDWATLPERCVVQIHAMREEPFAGQLDRHEFRVVVLARHPFDVLISALNYEQYIANPCLWTDAAGRTRSLRGATPHSAEFLEYATATHPGSVLSISPDWWTAPGVYRVRYEDLVQEPAGTLASLAALLHLEPRRPIAQVVAELDISTIRAGYDVWHYHYWQGRPGLWRSLLPAQLANQIAAMQRPVFETLGYVCDPNESLSATQAEATWCEIQLQSVRQHLSDERTKHARTKDELGKVRDHLDRVHGILYDERIARSDALAALEAARDEAQQLEDRLQEFEHLNPRAVGFAKRLNALAHRYRAIRTNLGIRRDKTG
jgi:hypothetical protein